MQNNSGIQPVDLKVLFLPDPTEEKIGSILLSDQEKERRAWKRNRGTIVALGKSTFAEWLEKPQPGDRVVISQNAGSKALGDDDQEYWIINDEDILARLEK